MSDVTRILSQIESGDAAAADQLLPLVYDELRMLAARKLAQEKPGQTLQATALVHEAYLRLLGTQPDKPWTHRGHFFLAAAEAMRRILIDQARRKGRQKRGGDHNRIELDAANVAIAEPAENLLALNEALSQFEQESPRKAELVKLRYFAGLTVEQAAELLGISSSTADNYWAYARSWLRIKLTDSDDQN